MHSSKLFGRLAGAAAGALLVALVAAMQPASADEPGVARLTAINGDVAIRRGDSNATYAAADNAPLMASDYVSTGSGASRAEIQFDYGNFLRLGTNVQMRLSQLDPSSHVAQLAAGTVELSILHDTGARPEIDTPSVAVRPNGVGQYRVTVNPDGSTLVSVRSGSVSLAGGNTGQTVSSGQTVVVNGSASNPQFQSVPMLAYDSFDSWNQARDAFDGNDSGYQYANNGITGVQDLSQYGSWQDNSQYGYGWTPSNVGSNWSPYQNGQWAWQPYYGYTWVGNEPWGWAPYHYGTWMYNNTAWTWYPNAGPMYPSGQYPYVGQYAYGGSPYGYASPYGAGYPGYGYGYPPYANGYPYQYGYPYSYGSPNTSAMLWQPALVTFLGLLTGQPLGSALMNGLASTSLGWSPLAPGEPMYPWWGPQQAAWYGYPSSGYPNYQTYGYGQQPIYVQGSTQPSVTNSYNTYNITKIYKIYRNTRAPHGVMVVSGSAFQNGQWRAIRAQSLAQTHFTNVAVFRNVVPVAPTQAHLRYTTQPGPTRIAAIAPKTQLFARFRAPKFQPAPFVAVRNKVVATTQKLYSAHPTMPGPVIAHRTLNAPKPPAEFVHKVQTQTAHAPKATVVGKPATPAWQRFNAMRHTNNTMTVHRPATTTTVKRSGGNV
ncbi:MAG: FecR domain-containing protein, partial [Candidatus Eremiobacteraeota bacterium]|nr:FecR domain-containing protein [Candidatus Eremiobacteraeota bacterium]